MDFVVNVVYSTSMKKDLKAIKQVAKLRNKTPKMTFRAIAKYMKRDLKSVYRWYQDSIVK